MLVAEPRSALPSPPESPTPGAISKIVRFRSPPRSPRMSSLLLALGDIIEQDDDEDDSSEDSITHEWPAPMVSLITVSSPETQESGLDMGTIPQETVNLMPLQDEDADSVTIFNTPLMLTSYVPVVAAEESYATQQVSVVPVSEPGDVESDEDVTITQYRDSRTLLPLPAGLMSPARAVPDVSVSPVANFEHAYPATPIVGSTNSDDTVIITDYRHSRASLPLPIGLLSPICSTSHMPISLPAHSESPMADVHREDSIDSGYADGCFMPSTFLTSPPRSPRRISTLSILSSPFGSPTSRIRSYDEQHPPVMKNLFSPTFTSMNQLHDADVNVARYSDVDDDPALEDAEIGQAVSVDFATGEEGQPLSSGADEYFAEIYDVEHVALIDNTNEHVQAHTHKQSPRPSLALSSASTGGHEQGSSCGTSRVQAEGDTSLSTASSGPASSRDDTMQSLYDRYLISPEEKPLPSPHESRRISRGTVFSPRIDISNGKSETATSPVLLSPFEELPTRVFSVAEKGKSSPRGHDSESGTRDSHWDRRASTKVPFAWRQSLKTDRPISLKPTSSIVRPRPPALIGFSPKIHDRTRLLSPEEPSTASSGLKPLRLSVVLSSASTPASSSFPSSAPASSIPPSLTTGTTAFTPSTSSSPTVSSDYSLSHNRLLSSRPSSSALARTHGQNTLIIDPTSRTPSVPLDLDPDRSPGAAPHSAPVSSHGTSTPWHSRQSSRLSLLSSHRCSNIEPYPRSDSRLSEPAILYEVDEDAESESMHGSADWADETIRRPASSLAPDALYPPSPPHAIATPKPTLMFALASDNVDEVRRVLESGEAGPNDDVGPQSALAFTLSAKQLTNRVAMAKLLLAHGADPSMARDVPPAQPQMLSADSASVSTAGGADARARLLEELDPATRYYVKRADAPQTRRASALIHRSFFRPLARVRYDLVGQDRALEQLFRVLSMPSMAPVVVLLCGPSGHGKSLLARKFGSLLDVPTHTVNMTTLRSTHDIWRSYSMSPYEESSTCTLSEFLIANEGKRCVVVLDEIEKVEDQKFLSSLLMPWELGRCSMEAGQRHVDVSQVIWLGTSNVGHELVFEHNKSRPDPDSPMSREEYVDLMGLLRPRVSERLGASLLSRVTTVLPFVPFTPEEKMAISAEALYALAGEGAGTLPPATVDMLVRKSLGLYHPAEGARSLYRAVSTLLLDTI
ncbi:uncharacterized protein FIBRA_03624 [Fibroporia radiculosa]|uniref:ATPase dynein-related AAA domain-containing protein n=1 Tax=Fibroporia radiculosa TaxID=599839 RepID=J4H2I1_9APHY|nr:uncharacterized protein FIBRA_03624 [Fibroporia radiculosa]CCM01564.1 predicted protein [Fibroporia radiculosa]